MTPYRFARRSFLASLGGALGLRILFENLEAAAEGATSPPRLLLAHWPLGTIRHHFMPVGSGFDYQTSRILRPFEEQGLRDDMIALYGLDHTGIDGGGGGGHEAGTVAATTGANSPGTRDNGGEADDASAGGPSFDQIFLRRVPALVRPGLGYVNAICDSRVESYETSTRCLSYGYDTRLIMSARPGGTISEHTPLLPTLSPATLYASLFSGFMPGAPSGEALKALLMRRSVLDSALHELQSMKRMVPASQWEKIDVHTQAIRKIEEQIQQQIDGGSGPSCTVPNAPDPSIIGKSGRGTDGFGNPTPAAPDNDLHQAVGELHLGIIRAAFQCDLVRVATFQWAPGTSQVAFRGLDPTTPNAIYRHHPQSHHITSPDVTNGPPPSGGDNALTYEFLANVHTWYNTRMAEALRTFKDATDAFGSNLLDVTIVPFVTEVAEATHTRTTLPALIFGGRALGMRGGQFQDFSASPRPHNDLWATIAQAYLQTADPLATPALRDEVFVKNGVRPITGLWTPPA